MAASRPSEQRQVVWDTLAQFWVDGEWAPDQLDEFAHRISKTSFSIEQLNRIAMWEVCGGFAKFSLIAAYLATVLPDDYFPEGKTREMVRRFISHPVRSALNPFWLPGFLLARSFMKSFWPELRQRIQRMRAVSYLATFHS